MSFHFLDALIHPSSSRLPKDFTTLSWPHPSSHTSLHHLLLFVHHLGAQHPSPPHDSCCLPSSLATYSPRRLSPREFLWQVPCVYTSASSAFFPLGLFTSVTLTVITPSSGSFPLLSFTPITCSFIHHVASSLCCIPPLVHWSNYTALYPRSLRCRPLIVITASDNLKPSTMKAQAGSHFTCGKVRGMKPTAGR